MILELLLFLLLFSLPVIYIYKKTKLPDKSPVQKISCTADTDCPDYFKCVNNFCCSTSCAGKNCSETNDCGDSCLPLICSSGQTCFQGNCCTKDCAGKCNISSCGVDCNTCGANQECNMANGVCVQKAQCGENECGKAGCPNSCKNQLCQTGNCCLNGQCVYDALCYTDNTATEKLLGDFCNSCQDCILTDKDTNTPLQFFPNSIYPKVGKLSCRCNGSATRTSLIIDNRVPNQDMYKYKVENGNLTGIPLPPDIQTTFCTNNICYCYSDGDCTRLSPNLKCSEPQELEGINGRRKCIPKTT